MSKRFEELKEVFGKLLSPDGCPWDRAQTHATLLKYLREETKEFCDAVKSGSDENMKEELGDILLQVMFHSRLAENEGRFDIEDVIETLIKKLRRRHPHVFSNKKNRPQINSPEEVVKHWNRIKRKEKNEIK